jgi:isoquinoline 1-oxidoreductase beta subunit
VKQVVQISDGVAVVADTYWHAARALEATDIKWNEGAGKALQLRQYPHRSADSAAKPGAVFKKVGDAMPA